MSRRLLVVNVVLGLLSVVLAAGIVRTLLVNRPLPPPSPPRATSAPASVAAAETGEAELSAYAVIATRNLFSPARGETATVAVPVVKPILHGVVIDGAKSRAFLEDPTTKRVAGYSVGDTVGAGRIQHITDDRVVIARPEGLFEVMLRDPSKPKAAPTPAAGPAQSEATPTATAVRTQTGPGSPAAPPSPPQVRRRFPAPSATGQ